MEKLKLSHNKISTWQRCHKAYYWSYVEKLTPKEKAMPLQVGDIVHKLFHLQFTNKLTPEMLEKLDEFVLKLYPENAEGLSAEVAYEAARLFVGYLTRWKDDPIKPISSEVHLEVEFPNYILIGKVDRLTRPPDKKLWRHEYKTAGKMDSQYLTGLKGGLQGAIYDYLTEKVFEEQVSGTIYDILVKTKVPQYDRAYATCNRKAIQRMLETVEGVYRDIMREDYYPSSNCFSYNTDCAYKILCEFDSPTARKAFYNRKEVKENEDQHP